LRIVNKQQKPGASGENHPITFETVRELARRLPGVVEGTSYGTLGFRVGKSLFARQHQDGESLVIKIESSQRAMRMRADPETFFITDHYVHYPWMLVRLSTVDRDDLRDLLDDAWRLSAPKKLLSSYECDPVGKRRGQARKPRDG
jgi:hypothetical protein